jgi:hypothetical protein
MGLATLLKIICRYIKCNSNSSCGGKDEISDSIKENHKKKIRKKNHPDYDDELYVI